MKNRNYMLKIVDKLENRLSTLDYMTSRSTSISDFKKEISNSKELLEEIKSLIEKEPLSGYELNKIN